jgi:ABC-type branched-subunit amino acid transport system substrate-binding protein
VKKKLLAVAMASLMVAACTSGDEGEGTADTTAAPVPASTGAPSTEAPSTAPDSTEPESTDVETTEPATSEPAVDEEFVDQSLTGPAPGVTDDTIKVGITYIDLGSVEGLSTNHGDYAGTYTALIDDLNANGGINGRLIEPVIVPISLADGGNADAVCLQLTEDEQVFVVMGFFLNDAPACYLELHETAIVGGTQTEDLLSRAKAPWYTSEIGSDFEADAIRKFAEDGLLDGTLGIMASSTDQALLDGTILPTLAELGIEPAEVAVNDAPTTDTAAVEAQAATIIERMEAAGVDTILAPTNNAPGVAQALEDTSYRPVILATNQGALTAFIQEEGHDLSVLDGAVSASIFGPVEANVAQPGFLECREVTEAAGIEWIDPAAWVEGPRPWVSLSAACNALTLFKAIATYAGPNLNYATYQEAGNTIGEVQMPTIPDPFFYGAPPHADGDAPVYLFVWDPATKSFVLP